MASVGFWNPVRETRERALERCSQLLPCLSDPGRRSSCIVKVALIVLHLIFVGVLFLFDGDLRDTTQREPWYTAIYLLLLFVTLIQYFITSASSPGYVIDAKNAWNGTHVIFSKTSKTSTQSASSKNGSLISPSDGHQKWSDVYGMNQTPWEMLVMNMYPTGSSSRHWTCLYCNIVQPPRAKHCHDCDKCVLQFDHHCVWLGTCIGQGNHCRFWWYLLEESASCIWTGIFYITFLKVHTARWKDVVVILLLIVLGISLIFLLLLLLFHSYLMLTNQTTHELVRRRRISYMRAVPDRVCPFSSGICRNLYDFCSFRRSIYDIEPLPTAEVLKSKARPYTCMDVVSCHCC